MSEIKDKSTGKYGTRGSVSRALPQGDDLSPAEVVEQGAPFELSFIESFNDPQVSTKLQKIMKLATKDLMPWGQFVTKFAPWNSS